MVYHSYAGATYGRALMCFGALEKHLLLPTCNLASGKEYIGSRFNLTISLIDFPPRLLFSLALLVYLSIHVWETSIIRLKKPPQLPLW